MQSNHTDGTLTRPHRTTDEDHDAFQTRLKKILVWKHGLGQIWPQMIQD